jgi:hypothetical protein
MGVGSALKKAVTSSMLRGPTEYEARHLVAQKNAMEMLGLPANNTAAQRAKAMGMQDFYHGSKQDIQGGFTPVYDDNLAFVTPDAKFANDWIGKGARQKRVGAEADAEVKAVEDAEREIRGRTDYDALNKLEGDAFREAYDREAAIAKAAQANEIGIPSRSVHATVYPVKAAPGKSFNPDENFSDMLDFLKMKGYDTDPRMVDMYKTGNYLPYETKEVVNYLKGKGYNSMQLRESTGGPITTTALFDPNRVRSRFAAFDPARAHEADMLGYANPQLLKLMAGASAGAAAVPILTKKLRED